MKWGIWNVPGEAASEPVCRLHGSLMGAGSVKPLTQTLPEPSRYTTTDCCIYTVEAKERKDGSSHSPVNQNGQDGEVQCH